SLHCQRLAPWVSRALPVLITFLLPFVWLAQALTRRFTRRQSQPPQVSRDEIAALARLGHEQGTVVEAESRILINLLRSGHLRARDMMTPRTVLASLPEELSVREALDQRTAMRFSRIPVWRAREDDVVGYVLKDELLLLAAQGQDARGIGELRRSLLVMPESLPVAVLFERLLDRREQIAMVVDEYGDMVGVVTMEDVVETMLGLEIVDEADAVRDMRAMARRQWSIRAQRMGIDESTLVEISAETRIESYPASAAPEDSMKHAVAHDLSAPLALDAARHALASYEARYAKYQPTVSWDSDALAHFSFTAKGIKLQGQLALQPQAIEITVQVPLMFRWLQKRAIEVVEQEVQMWLGRAKNGELS
ncbi:MAG: polyhydroxyalkanoic acid system family protein, partial [Polyangiales bacterium]